MILLLSMILLIKIPIEIIIHIVFIDDLNRTLFKNVLNQYINNNE